jgi:hypothetical protein
MPLAQFLNILCACLGFAAAIFFAVGAILTGPRRIFRIAKSYWDINSHWADSICDQRADYVAGALLLVASFSFQLWANLIPIEPQPAQFQPYGCAMAEIGVALIFLLLFALLLRNSVSKSSKEAIRQMQAEVVAREELESKVDVLSRKNP